MTSNAFILEWSQQNRGLFRKNLTTFRNCGHVSGIFCGPVLLSPWSKEKSEVNWPSSCCYNSGMIRYLAMVYVLSIPESYYYSQGTMLNMGDATWTAQRYGRHLSGKFGKVSGKQAKYFPNNFIKKDSRNFGVIFFRNSFFFWRTS